MHLRLVNILWLQPRIGGVSYEVLLIHALSDSVEFRGRGKVIFGELACVRALGNTAWTSVEKISPLRCLYPTQPQLLTLLIQKLWSDSLLLLLLSMSKSIFIGFIFAFLHHTFLHFSWIKTFVIIFRYLFTYLFLFPLLLSPQIRLDSVFYSHFLLLFIIWSICVLDLLFSSARSFWFFWFLLLLILLEIIFAKF